MEDFVQIHTLQNPVEEPGSEYYSQHSDRLHRRLHRRDRCSEMNLVQLLLFAVDRAWWFLLHVPFSEIRDP